VIMALQNMWNMLVWYVSHCSWHELKSDMIFLSLASPANPSGFSCSLFSGASSLSMRNRCLLAQYVAQRRSPAIGDAIGASPNMASLYRASVSTLTYAASASESLRSSSSSSLSSLSSSTIVTAVVVIARASFRRRRTRR
jgi:hypothetical protein